MRTPIRRFPLLTFLALLLLPCILHAQATPQTLGSDLVGTSWQFVRFHGPHDTILTTDDKTKFTIAFAPDNSVSVRIDCNRGHGMWKSDAPNQLALGPLALTRAMCPPDPLGDSIVKNWDHINSYTIDKGHLHLSLADNGGVYELDPVPVAAKP